MHQILRLSVLLSLCLAVAVEARLRGQLELFFDFAPQDSVVRLEQPAAGQLRVEVVDTESGERRVLTERVAAGAAERLREQALEQGVSVGTWVAGRVDATTVDGDGRREDYLSGPRELRRNRLNYVITQTVYSMYVYSIAVPVAFDAPDKAAAAQLLSIPVGFGTHFYLSRDKEFHDAHVWSTAYFAGSGIALSYAIPFALLGFNETAFRTGSLAAMAGYPVGLWMGYTHGDQLVDNPGRVRLQSTMAVTAAAMGFLTGMTWTPENGGDIYGRVMVAQAAAAGVAGHYLSYSYRAHEAVPAGVGTGVGTHAILGFLGGATLAVWADLDDVRPAAALMLAGTGAGLAEGLYFFRNRYDSFEKARYDRWGAIGGAVIPLGLAALFGGEPDPKLLMGLTTAGAVGGYAITYSLTSHLQESPRDVRHKGHPGFSFDLMPVPEMYAYETPEGREVAMRLRVPGATLRF